MSAFAAGQKVLGKVDTYILVAKLSTSIWRAKSCNTFSPVILKFGPTARLEREKKALQLFRGHHAIRQLLDETEDPQSLVLTYLDSDLLAASSTRQFERREIKAASKAMLEALAAFHREKWAHTDNVLCNFSSNEELLNTFQLADCGDSLPIPTDRKTGYRVIGASIFRSPEAMLNLDWGIATDIWSFGTTLISLLWGGNWHIFKPPGVDPSDERYTFEVLRRHDLFFGPFPSSYIDIADQEALQILTAVTELAETRKPFSLTKEIDTEDRDFVCKVMKLDPRDRPSAAELLDDAWFSS